MPRYRAQSSFNAGSPSTASGVSGGVGLVAVMILGIARQDGASYATVMRTISLKLPDDLLAQLESEAKARRVTKSWLVRESLERALRQQAPGGAVSCYDLARDLAGTMKGLPEDLADSSRYMGGFGQ